MKKLGIIFLIFAMLVSVMAVAAFADTTDSTGPVIFIKDGGTGDGSSPDKAMAIGGITETDKLYKNAPLYRAWKALLSTGGTIVICGPYTLNAADAGRNQSTPDIVWETLNNLSSSVITYTSVWDGVDYRETADAKLIFGDKNVTLTLPSASVFTNITIVAGQIDADRDNCIAAGFNPLTLGTGTTFVANANGEYPTVMGGHRAYNGLVAVQADSNITVDIGNENTIGDIYGGVAYTNKDQNGNSNITIKSGKIGSVYGDNNNKHGYGFTGSINIDIQGGIFRGEIAITNNGYGAGSEKASTLKISGGDFSACTGIKATSQFFDKNCPTRPAPANPQIDCTGASCGVYEAVKAVTSLEITNAPEHSYGEATYTWSDDNSACTATRSCSCGYTQTATATVTSTVTAPTCTADGSATYTATFTESWAAAQTKTGAGDKATGHTYGDITYTWSDDNSACTATHSCSCGNTQTATATVTSVVTAVTCTTDGSTTYTAAFTESWAAAQTKVVEGEKAQGHTSGEAVVENKVDATCDKAGSYENVVSCTVCGAEISRETVEIPAAGHVDADGNNACDTCNVNLTNAETGDTILAVVAAAVISAMGIVALPAIKKRF